MNAYTLRPPRPGARKARSRRRRGLSLFSVLMGLAVASVAIIGAVALYNTTTESQNRNQAQALLTTLTIAVQQIYQGSSNYGDTSNNIVPQLALRNAIPSSARRDADPTNPVHTTAKIMHPFGGEVTLTGSGSSPGDGRFITTFKALEASTCGLILDPFIGQTRAGGGLWDIKVGSTAVAFPPTAPGITTACASGGDVAFTFE